MIILSRSPALPRSVMFLFVLLSLFQLLRSADCEDLILSHKRECSHDDQVCIARQPGIQIIDISPLLKNSTEHEKNAVRSLIGSACRSWGMFYITNHGTEAIGIKFAEQMEKFFESSQEVKGSVRRMANNSRGFADDELTKQKVGVRFVSAFTFLLSDIFLIASFFLHPSHNVR